MDFVARRWEFDLVEQANSVISPVRLFLLCLALWVVCWLAGPFAFPFAYPMRAGLLLVFATGLFVVGALLGVRVSAPGLEKTRADLSPWIASPRFVRLLWFVLLVAILGETLRTYDRVVLRGLDLAASTVETRLELVAAGQSIGTIGVISAVLYPFCFPVFVLARLGWQRLSIGAKATITLVCAYPVFEGFVQGGIVAGAMTLLFYYFVSRATSAPVSVVRDSRRGRRFAVVIVGTAFFLVAAAQTFVSRVDYLYKGITAYMAAAEEVDVVEYTPAAYEFVEKYGAAAFVPIWLMHYYSMGVHKFFYLVDHFDTDDYLYGAFQLYVPLKFLAALGLGEVSLERFEAVNPMPGHYQTFWGPAYMDFGLAMPIEALVIGVICGLFYRWCVRKTFLGIAIYPYLQANIVLAFLTNGITGERSYFFFSLGVTSLWAMFSMVERRKRMRMTAHARNA